MHDVIEHVLSVEKNIKFPFKEDEIQGYGALQLKALTTWSIQENGRVTYSTKVTLFNKHIVFWWVRDGSKNLQTATAGYIIIPSVQFCFPQT